MLMCVVYTGLVFLFSEGIDNLTLRLPEACCLVVSVAKAAPLRALHGRAARLLSLEPWQTSTPNNCSRPSSRRSKTWRICCSIFCVR